MMFVITVCCFQSQYSQNLKAIHNADKNILEEVVVVSNPNIAKI